jgi:hypothetical protein
MKQIRAPANANLSDTMFEGVLAMAGSFGLDEGLVERCVRRESERGEPESPSRRLCITGVEIELENEHCIAPMAALRPFHEKAPARGSELASPSVLSVFDPSARYMTVPASQRVSPIRSRT